MKNSVVSSRKTKSYAALAGLTLNELNDAAGFGNNYIYRLWGSDSVNLVTLNRIAATLSAHGVDVRAADLLEEVDVPHTQSKAPAAVVA
jgi:hypothetical protein